MAEEEIKSVLKREEEENQFQNTQNLYSIKYTELLDEAVRQLLDLKS